MWEGEHYNPFEIQQCKEVLEGALKHDLLMEVLIVAFQYKESNPDASLLECLQEGAMEWDL